MKDWLLRNRSSTRIAFVLHTMGRIVSACLSLIWTPLLLHTMGAPLYGLFLSFQAVAALGGLGDLGMGGAIALAMGRFLGSGDGEGAQRFLSVARTVFFSLAVGLGAAFLMASPWLPWLLKFKPVPGSGSLAALFLLTAPVVMLTVFSSYLSNLNYAVANVTWPIVPSLVLSQSALAGHWLLARHGAPLWLQYLPYAISIVATVFILWSLLRISHPELARLTPLHFDGVEFRALLARSGWLYLIALGCAVYTTTDRLVINAAFGPGAVPAYQLNYKVCELILFAIVAAGFVSMPKLTQWLASPDPAVQARARSKALRLNRFICFLGSAAAVVYLGANDTFIALWIGPAFHVPIAWQAAFALNLAVTAGTSVSLDLTVRVDASGLRRAGLSVAAAAVLNFGLSVAAVYFWRSPLGVALATVLAELVQTVGTGLFVTGRLALSRARWLLESTLWPLMAAAGAAGLRWVLSGHGSVGGLLYAAGALAIIAALGSIYGIDRDFVLGEWRLLTKKSAPRP